MILRYVREALPLCFVKEQTSLRHPVSGCVALLARRPLFRQGADFVEAHNHGGRSCPREDTLCFVKEQTSLRHVWRAGQGVAGKSPLCFVKEQTSLRLAGVPRPTG